MYRVLIADDEKIVLDGIKFIIDKNFKNIEYGTARSGREAIQKTDEFRPDIILMDIRMPGINGIEAIKEIKYRYDNIHFIIISAYEQFDFAKEALNLGVINYILKPINKNNLIAALKKAINAIDEKNDNRKKAIEDIEKYEKMKPFIEYSFIYSIILGSQAFITTERYRKMLSLKLDSGYIIVVEFENLDYDIFDKDTYLKMRDLLKYKCNCIIGPPVINRIVIFVSDLIKEEYSQRLESIDICEYIVRCISNINRQIEISIGIGSCKNIDNVYASYEEALRALSCGKNKDINHIKDLIRDDHIQDEYPKEYEKKLIEMCNAGQTEAAIEVFSEIYIWVYEKYKFSFETGKNKLLELMVIIHSNTQFTKMQNQYYKNYIFDILNVENYLKLENWCRNRICSICSDINKEQSKNIKKIILKAKCYIDKNYSSEITLDEISKEVCVTPHYFSRLFKDEMGENYIDYLTKIRINKAKELMKNNSMSIKEIGYSIGYNDPNYFSRIFKKVEQITPTEYLKRIRINK